MAVVLPLLLLILFGIIDFGMLLNRQILLTEAAHAGARAAAFGQTSDVSAKAAAVLGATPTSVTVTACPPNAGTDVDAQVVLTYRYEAMTPLGSLMGLFGQNAPDSFELSAKGVMACVG
jgi:Flp pilus assembly protein TadG